MQKSIYALLCQHRFPINRGQQRVTCQHLDLDDRGARNLEKNLLER